MVKARAWNQKIGKTCLLLTGSLLSLTQEPSFFFFSFWYATEYLQVLFCINDLKNMKVHIKIYTFSTLKYAGTEKNLESCSDREILSG